MEWSSCAFLVGEKRGDREDKGLSFGLRSVVPPHKLNRAAAYDFLTPLSSAAAAPMGVFPFTTAQWQELQRQELIYKHIMAAVPVPPDLLLPSAARAFPEAPPAILFPSTAGAMNLRFMNSTDPEPGRCRRTDGKKWRCSRDAPPDQKYCERHMHRNRPRSRKPVEPRKPKLRPPPPTAAPSTAVYAPDFKLNLPLHSVESTHEQRCEDWMKSYSRDFASINYVQLRSLNYTDDCFPFPHQNVSPLGHRSVADYSEPTRRFVGACSGGDVTKLDDSLTSRREKQPLSSLTLSMSNGNEPLSWSPAATNSPPGGPLAEVLQSNKSNISSPTDNRSGGNCVDLINLMCKGSGPESQQVSTGDNHPSSPSAVLQRALVSLSDSSSCSSPTFAAAASRSEFGFNWMKQYK